MGALGQFVSTPPGGTVVVKLDLRALFIIYLVVLNLCLNGKYDALRINCIQLMELIGYSLRFK